LRVYISTNTPKEEKLNKWYQHQITKARDASPRRGVSYNGGNTLGPKKVWTAILILAVNGIISIHHVKQQVPREKSAASSAVNVTNNIEYCEGSNSTTN
jgi:hypothetical protein